jgi:hypothetical protein
MNWPRIVRGRSIGIGKERKTISETLLAKGYQLKSG